MGKKWEDILSELGVSKKIMNNPKAREAISSHIVNAIILPNVPNNRILRYIDLSKQPLPEIEQDDFEELMTVLRASTLFTMDEIFAQKGSKKVYGGMDITSDTVVLEYCLVGHDRFSDHMSETVISLSGDNVQFDTEKVGYDYCKCPTTRKYEREIVGPDGQVLEHIESDQALEEKASFESLKDVHEL